MKTRLLRLIFPFFLALMCMSVYAQTTTITYTAKQKLDRFEEIDYFVGATAVQSHEFIKEGDNVIGNGTVVYEGTVTEFANYCLQLNYDLVSIVIPEGVTKLGFQAFKWCTSLTDISLPTTLEEIGDVSGLAFEGCNNLENGKFVIKDLKWWCGLVIKGVYSNPVYYAKHIYDAEGNEITDLVIPDDVTCVGDYTFARCEGLKTVTFHDNVTYIGSNAFANCTGLTTVALPKNMKKLSEYAFSRCSNLASVAIPEGMEDIGFCAFNYSGLTSLTLPSTINKMSQSFHNCEKLETLTLTDGISNIGGSFYSCNALKEVRIPGSLKTMTYQDFMRCENLETVIIEEGVEEVAGFQECPKLVNLTIPSSAKTLGGLGFRDCTSLVTVNLPEGVEYVSSFDGCTSLQQINFPSTITYVGTFKNCTALKTVIVDDLKSWCEARHYDSNLYGPQKMAGKLCMKNTKGEIEEITKLVIPEGTTKLEGGAFCHLKHLTSVTIPGTVKYLGGLSFTGCTGLTEIELPEGLERFGYMDFAGCTNLATLTIPSTVNYIDQGAFVELPAIETIWCRAFPNELYWRYYNDGSFFMPEKATKFHVVNATAWLEKFPEANVTYVGDIEVGTSVVTYYADAKLEVFDDYTKFKGIYSLVSHDFADGQGSVHYQGEVSGIGANAFRNIEGLTSVLIPEGTTVIDNYAFLGCTGLTTMTIPASVTTIGNYAFSSCTGLTTLTIKDPVENAAASKRAPETESVGLQRIGRGAFEYCSQVITLSLPATLTEIDYEAFLGMTSLADVWCNAEASNVTWNGSENASMFMINKATQFHVGNAADWLEKFPDANVTFVNQSSGIHNIDNDIIDSNCYYTLNGRRLNGKPTQRGIYINNGKKYMIK